jgi:hypothetical protein
VIKMIECSRCKNNCPNIAWEMHGIDTSEFCTCIVEQINQLAAIKLQQQEEYMGIPLDLTQKHLQTIANARDFWHPEELFEEVEVVGMMGDEIGADEYSFYTIFDGLVDELFEYDDE